MDLTHDEPGQQLLPATCGCSRVAMLMQCFKQVLPERAVLMWPAPIVHSQPPFLGVCAGPRTRAATAAAAADAPAHSPPGKQQSPQKASPKQQSPDKAAADPAAGESDGDDAGSGCIICMVSVWRCVVGNIVAGTWPCHLCRACKLSGRMRLQQAVQCCFPDRRIWRSTAHAVPCCAVVDTHRS
jgi:hypothetical protein